MESKLVHSIDCKIIVSYRKKHVFVTKAKLILKKNLFFTTVMFDCIVHQTDWRTAKFVCVYLMFLLAFTREIYFVRVLCFHCVLCLHRNVPNEIQWSVNIFRDLDHNVVLQYYRITQVKRALQNSQLSNISVSF